MQVFTLVFWIQCKFFIVLPILLKICRSNDFFFLLRQNVNCVKTVNPSDHENVIQIGLTGKKISCYMGDSACRWFIVKKLKYSGVMLNIFEFSRVWENWSMQMSFLELPNHISRLTSWNKVSASFFFLLLRFLTIRISLYFNETKKLNFYLHSYCQTLLSNQVRRT